jgi:hypothetical protein
MNVSRDPSLTFYLASLESAVSATSYVPLLLSQKVNSRLVI